MPSITTKFQFVNSPFIFLLTHYTRMFRPLRAIFRWDRQLDIFKDYFYHNGSVARTQLENIRHLHLQHRQHTSHEEETSNNRPKTKSLHCPQLDHHDADGLAGHKAWRTTQTIMRRYKRLLISIFNILTFLHFIYATGFHGEFEWFYNFYICIKFDNMYWGPRVEAPM
jgi:hypothetical protein